MPLRRRAGLVLGGTVMLGLLVPGPAGAAAAASGQVCTGVVIDDGGYNGSGAAAVQAANVGSGSSDLQALQAAGDTVYQNNSGLVCAIDDGTGEVPANGVQNCTATSGSDYFYWSYWEGDPYTNTWSYASIGPAEHTVSTGQTYVEGWRFENPGPDNATAPKLSITPAAAFAQACPGIQPVPAGGSGAGSGGSGSGSPGGSSSPGTPGPSVPATTTTTVAADGGSTAPRTASSSPTSSGLGATPTTHQGAATTTTGPTGGTRSTSTTTANGNAEHHDDNAKAGLADPRPHGAPGGGDPALPIVIVAAVIMLLGGLAWWRWRRRPLEE